MFDYFLYKCGRFLVVRLSLDAGYKLATFLSILKYYLSPRDRRAVIGNLRMILPQELHKDIHRYAREVFINFGKYLIEFFRCLLLKKDDLNKWIKIEGTEHIEDALAKKKGVIILSAHIGNWELGGVFMSLLGYPMVAVALPHKHHKVNSLFNQQREKMGVLVIPSMGIAIRQIYNALNENKIIALVGDRDFSNTGKRMDFLGATKTIPRGPAVLSLRTGAPIIPGFVIRQQDDSYIIEFSKPLAALNTEEEIMSEYVKVIEAKIRQYPTQWLMFREFWNE